jgi:hypothetical protein
MSGTSLPAWQLHASFPGVNFSGQHAGAGYRDLRSQAAEQSCQGEAPLSQNPRRNAARRVRHAEVIALKETATASRTEASAVI